MKQKLFTLAALASLASLVACQREESGNLEDGKLVIGLQMEDLSTKVDVDGNTGACTWTSGDQIGICVTDSNGSAYQQVAVNTSAKTVHVDLETGKSITPGYSVSPFIMADNSDSGKTGATPKVNYLTSYSMAGKDLTDQTFSWVPMMAINNDEVLRFYHTGALLRLVLDNVPENTVKLTVKFVGMTDVCGTCTVTNPGTYKATTAITTGGKNVVTFTNVTRSTETMYLNVPLPSIDFSTLTSIRIEAFNSSDASLGIVSKSVSGWGTLKHGYGRLMNADFSADLLSGVRLSSTATVTLWKSQTIQRTATAVDTYGLDYADATVEWSSDDPNIATVNQTTGLVTAKGDGTCTITARATPNTGGASQEASYTVNVNAISGLTLATAGDISLVKVGRTLDITATITHTTNGTINSMPSDLFVNWSSGAPSRVSLASSTSVPVRISENQLSTTVTLNGVDDGSSTITASATSAYVSSGSAQKLINCEYITSITFPFEDGDGKHGEPYKFRGIWIHPGFVFRDSGGTFSIIGEDDPLILLQHYWYDGQTEKFTGTGTAWQNVCYFSWYTFGTSWTRVLNDDYGYHTWRLPTAGSSSGDWYTLWNGTPSIKIKINSTEYTDNSTANKIFVRVDLTGTLYENKGLGDNSYLTQNAKPAQNKQFGLLLVPDGAFITCSGINSVPGTSSYNDITYEKLKYLTDHGCIFLPANGYYSYSSTEKWRWWVGGTGSLYIAKTSQASNRGDFFSFNNHSCNTYSYDRSYYYGSVFLVRTE